MLHKDLKNLRGNLSIKEYICRGEKGLNKFGGKELLNSNNNVKLNKWDKFCKDDRQVFGNYFFI